MAVATVAHYVALDGKNQYPVTVSERTSQNRTRLGETLERYRTQVRLNQRHLARLSGVSWTMIQLLERGHRAGKPVNPSPQTLRLLAKGIAVNPLTNTVDSQRENDVYLDLMEAAGYLTRDDKIEGNSISAVSEAILRLIPNRPGEVVAQLLHQMHSLPDADREFLSRSVQTLIDGIARR